MHCATVIFEPLARAVLGVRSCLLTFLNAIKSLIWIRGQILILRVFLS